MLDKTSGSREVPDGGQEKAIHELAKVGPESRPWVLHPFLLAAFPIVSLFAHNVYEVQPRMLVTPLILSVATTFLGWLVLRVILGDASKAGLAASLIVVSFFGYKSFDEFYAVSHSNLSRLWVYDAARPNPLVSLAWETVFVLVVIALVIRRMKRPVRWTRTLNIFAAVLVGLPAFGATSARLKASAEPRREAVVPNLLTQGTKPDIYFIILDGYARGDVMKELYGFDNEPFLQRLERRGFFVARDSSSNYCQTRLSLASTLNANYLDTLIQPGSPDLLPLDEAIHSNLVRRTLKPLGYKFVSFATDFGPTDIADADLFFKPATPRAGFNQILLEMTPLTTWRSEVGMSDRFGTLRDRIEFTLDQLPEVAEVAEPTFTFAHFMAPHPPFVFGEHGEDVSPRRVLADGKYFDSRTAFRSPEYVREAYRKESVFLTERVERMINELLRKSPEPPVIILQSDHGSWLRYHSDDVEATDLHERFSILNCIYTGGREIDGIAEGMTSVNTFRAILHGVLGADLPLLKDRSYFSTFSNPLHFVDITDRLHSESERHRTFTYPKNYPGVDPQL